MRMHFISGLPRSGSTLLSAILKQNPGFKASVTSPVSMLWGALLPKMGPSGEFESFFDDERRLSILRATMKAYQGEDAQVAFDTNRTWTSKLALLSRVYPGAKTICCVRDVGSIIDSVERILRKNPLLTSRIFKFQPGSSVYSRAEILMNSETGLIGLPWTTMREAWFSEFANNLILIEYDKICRDPQGIVSDLYKQLGEPLFAHNFEAVAYDEPQYDADLGMPGMHRVRPKIEPSTTKPVIPPDLFLKYADASFWRRPEHLRGASIL